MTYRTILVHVDGSEGGQARAAMALTLAARFEASVTAVFLRSNAIPPVITGDGFAVIPGEIIRQLMDDRAKETARLSAVARTSFEAAARAASLPVTWCDINGDFDDELVACARRHDLSILPPRMKAALGQATLTAAHVGMASGSPILVVGAAPAGPSLGRRIIVAWKDTREAARAINDAWPLLKAAESVTVLMAAKHVNPASDSMMNAHFEKHRCKNVEFVVDDDDKLETADVIRKHISRLNADLVVLGLFGHSRLQEFILGGVSHDLLEQPPVPLLMSH